MAEFSNSQGYKITEESTSGVDTRDMGLAVEDMKMTAKARRRIFERRWYDNNFFDDGFHFRYLSRSSNKIVDLSERSTIYTPQRSIPKSSRQIRGISNLLMSSDPTPTVYPDPIDTSVPEMIPQPQQQQPQQQMQPGQPGQQVAPAPQEPNMVENPAYEKLVKRAKDIAQKRGKWLLDEWKKDDLTGETVLDKVALMTLLTMKHGISYMQVWPDEQDEIIRTQVYDAFDIYLLGNLTSIYQCPFLIKATPMMIAQIKANPIFDEDQLEEITPDNRKASSEIKEAYLQARYGRDTTSDQAATLILNEAFIKEYINEDNIKRIRAQDDGGEILKKFDKGHAIIRHVFTAGGVWLYDRYTNLDEYPFVDYRIEPGPLYQVPLIERFMPANKSLDSVVSRVERYTHTMVSGSWLKRRGENFKVNNIAGGQVIEYEATPPTQNQIAPIPPFVYEFISLLTNFIEEQGVSTTTLGKLPSGVKANAAIESLKESEYANLIIATRRLNSCMKRIARKFLEISDETFVTPHPVSLKEGKDLMNFSVIGASALEKRKKLKVETPGDMITLSKDVKVDIEIEQGMAYTKEGQKATMQNVINTFIQAVQVQAIPPAALTSVYKKYLEIYQFGATEEFMDDLDEAMSGQAMSDDEMTKMKMAVLSALQDAGEVGQEASQKRIMENKIGTLSALKDAGLDKKIMGQVPPAKESVSINYKDAPEDVKRQMEQEAGFQPAREPSPAVTDQALKHAQTLVQIKQATQEPEEKEAKPKKK